MLGNDLPDDKVAPVTIVREKIKPNVTFDEEDNSLYSASVVTRAKIRRREIEIDRFQAIEAADASYEISHIFLTFMTIHSYEFTRD